MIEHRLFGIRDCDKTFVSVPFFAYFLHLFPKKCKGIPIFLSILVFPFIHFMVLSFY